jgi:MoxR-like ATPase
MTSITNDASRPGATSSAFAGAIGQIEDNIGQVIKGKDETIQLVVACLLAEGHLLIEDVPGMGKTSVARALAASIEGSYGRIQFTPDLLPSDVTGVTVFNQGTHEFQFHPGTVFSNIVIADEINRASPKTQSALLEVMEERQVTVDGVARPVPRPFIVVATQNPIEMDGTYRLPEAQLDRFLMRISMGYPDREAEREILDNEDGGRLLRSLRPVVHASDVTKMIDQVARVHIHPAVSDYILAVSSATRTLPEVRLGVSPRGSLALLRATRALAAVSGRSYGIPEDVKFLAVNVLAHRMILHPDAELRGMTAADVVRRVLDAVPVPQVTPA